jgi:predicted RNase H-like HicB family nuclease
MRTRLNKKRKQKKRKRKFKPVIALNPDMAIDPITATIEVLTQAYAIGVGWDNTDDCFIAELSDFGVEVHGSTRDEAIVYATEAQRLLIETYRVWGYTLPSL